MIFNRHSNIAGSHAFLSASKYHWINYDDEKLERTYQTALASMLGTQLHEFASQAIKLGIRMPRNNKTLNAYVNDAIGFKMIPEQVLFYSENAFGTADAISFRDNMLRIHDLKTGVTKTSMNQLLVYVAFFCLEYGFKPSEIQVELRIYQNDEVQTYIPSVDEIAPIMSKIITFDSRIKVLRAEALA